MLLENDFLTKNSPVSGDDRNATNETRNEIVNNI